MPAPTTRSQPQPPAALRDAIRLHESGRLEAAVDAYRRILKRHPRTCACWANLGMALRQLGRKDEGLEALRRGARACPAFLPLNFNLGNALEDAGDIEGAVQSYRAALAGDPRHAGAAECLGRALLRLERFDEVVDHCRRALPVHARSAVLHQVLFAALAKLDHLEAAAGAYRRAAALAPPPSSFRAAFYWQVLRGLGRTAEAERELRAAAARDSRSAAAYTGLADLMGNRGRLDEALAFCDLALAIEPDKPEARFQRARARFLAGDYAAAWPDYAARPRRAWWQKLETAARPWKGQDLAGGSILLYGEQGLGDAIQFARYARLVARGGARVVLYVSPPLAALLRRLPDLAAVAVAGGRLLPRTDWICSLMDLPVILGAAGGSIRADCPYLPARRRRPPLLPPARQLRVGIVWAGSPRNELDRHRSCRLDHFAPLVELPGTEFVSFQVGPRAAELRSSGWHGLIRGLPEAAVPFEATADALMEVDLVITVDTALAHLAGAVGRPVWTLLSTVPDWRWMLERTDTPWYPTMRLFRQPAPGDWAGVFREVRAALAAWVAEAGR